MHLVPEMHVVFWPALSGWSGSVVDLEVLLQPLAHLLHQLCSMTAALLPSLPRRSLSLTQSCNA